MRTVLLIAFHFPPLIGSSGIQRTLRFAQHLPTYGWNPVILTATPNAYERVDYRTNLQIPKQCKVIRVPCFNTARVFSIAGRYPEWLALPDRWNSWTWLGRKIGIRACREFDIDAIWSSYPIASAHVLGARISSATGLPWIADFRDPMAQPGYPANPRQWKAYRSIEKKTASNAKRLIFVTPSALSTYQCTFPDTEKKKFVLLENGYEESVFDDLEPASGPWLREKQTITLLHSGVVYPSERDPNAFFKAISEVLKKGMILKGELSVRFRAPGHGGLIRKLAEKYQITDLIEILPAIPYKEAIREMFLADGLLLMQGSNCNSQIPAKMYEYLRAGRPILGLTDPSGDTGRSLKSLGISHIAKLENSSEIANTLVHFIQSVRHDTIPKIPVEQVEHYSRKNLTKRLAAIFDELIAQNRNENEKAR